MAVLEAMSCARSIWSLPDAGSRIFFGRCARNLHLLQGFRVNFSGEFHVSELKTSENAVKDELGEDSSDESAPSLKYRTPNKKKVKGELSQFLTSKGLSHLQAEKLVSKLSFCVILIICDLHASKRICTTDAIKSAIIPFVEALLRGNKPFLLNLNEPFYLIERLNLSHIKPYIDFLLEIGATESTIAKALVKFPRFCTLSITEDIEPMIPLLISYGLNKDRLRKVIERGPKIFSIGQVKMELILKYLCGLGLPKERVGKVIEIYPQILLFRVDNLETKSKYFESLGVDLVRFVSKSPQSLALSLEKNIKPVTKFFFDQGFSKEEFALMLSRYGRMYGRSLKKCIVPKWEFFLEMGYEKETLITYPMYFSYSLEKRIKPRYKRTIETGLRLPFHSIISSDDAHFEKYFTRRCMM